MTTTNEVDFRRCKSGEKHDWEYLGKVASAYMCNLCDLRVSKAALREATNA